MAKERKGRPGVMLWFDIRPSLKRLSPEEKGLLFEAIMDYAENGVLPEFEGMTGIAWDFIRPRIDLDAERYEQAVQQRRDAVNKRWHGEEQKDTAVSSVLRNIPTTTPSPTPKTNANSSSAPPAKPVPTAKPAAAKDFPLTPVVPDKPVYRRFETNGPVDPDEFVDAGTGRTGALNLIDILEREKRLKRGIFAPPPEHSTSLPEEESHHSSLKKLPGARHAPAHDPEAESRRLRELVEKDRRGGLFNPDGSLRQT